MKKYRKKASRINWEVLNIYEEIIMNLESMKINDVTEYRTKVTKELIDTIKKRYAQLCVSSNGIAIS